MSNRNLIIIGFILLFLPVSYYFFIALPNHNSALQQIEIDKLEYQKEQNSLREKKEQEERDRIETEKREKQERYDNCIHEANKNYDESLKDYCEMWYRDCKMQVQEHNRNLSEKFDYYWNSNELNVDSECSKFKYKNNWCFTMDKYSEKREEVYKKAIDYCKSIQ